jgi:hypothetical protein
VIIPSLQHCSSEPDPNLRCAYAKLLIEISLNCHSKRYSDLFDILEKVHSCTVISFYSISFSILVDIESAFRIARIRRTETASVGRRHGRYINRRERHYIHISPQDAQAAFVARRSRLLRDSESPTAALREAFNFRIPSGDQIEAHRMVSVCTRKLYISYRFSSGEGRSCLLQPVPLHRRRRSHFETLAQSDSATDSSDV